MAPGWYSGYFGFDGKNKIYGDRLGLFLRMDILGGDGGVQALATDTSWKARPCSIRYAEIYHGEIHDPGYQADEVFDTVVLPYDKAKLSPRRSLPVVVKERLTPKRVIHTPKGETVIDLWQNMAGWISFVCREPKGTKIRFQYGEVLKNGCFCRENLRSAKAEFTYISDGVERVVRPHLTYYRFRYAKIEGLTGEPILEDFRGEAIWFDMDAAGWVEYIRRQDEQTGNRGLWQTGFHFGDMIFDA